MASGTRTAPISGLELLRGLAALAVCLGLTAITGPLWQEPGPTRWLAVFGLTGGLLLFAQGW